MQPDKMNTNQSKELPVTPLPVDNTDLDKEVNELENDLYNQPTGAPPVQGSDNLLADITEEWIVEKNHVVNKEKTGLIIASCNLFRGNWEKTVQLIAQAPTLYRDNKELKEENNRMAEMLHKSNNAAESMLQELSQAEEENKALQSKINHLSNALRNILSIEKVWDITKGREEGRRAMELIKEK